MGVSDIPRRVQFFNFLNFKASLCVEAAQRTFQPWLLSSHSEALTWISDGLGSHIVKFSPSHRGRINSKHYMAILGDDIHSIVKALFPDGDGIFQDDNAPMHTAHVVKNWYEEHESELEHMEWPNLEIWVLLSICGASGSDKL